MRDEAGSRKSYDQIVADKDLLVATIKELKKELSFNVEELVKSEAEVERLAAENEKLKAEREDASALGDERIRKLEKDRSKLREALEVAREVFRNSERPARLGADHEMIAEALLIGLRGCEKALKGDSGLTPNETPK